MSMAERCWALTVQPGCVPQLVRIICFTTESLQTRVQRCSFSFTALLPSDTADGVGNVEHRFLVMAFRSLKINTSP